MSFESEIFEISKESFKKPQEAINTNFGKNDSKKSEK